MSSIIEVTVEQDSEQVVYKLHHSLLCEVSGYFRGCLQGSFSEATSGKIIFADVDLKAFELFARWLYTKELAVLEDVIPGYRIKNLIDVYVLADRLLCPKLKNRAMDMLQDMCARDFTPIEAFTKAVGAGLGQCHLTDFLMEILARDIVIMKDPEDYMLDDSWPELLATDGNFTAKLMAESIRLARPKDTDHDELSPYEGEGCRWHEHADDEDLGCRRWPQCR